MIWFFFLRTERTTITIGAGKRTGDAFVLAEAIKKVTSLYYPELTILIKETKGSSENVQLLEQDNIQLATVQADIAPSFSSRFVTNLYPDYFQLVVRENSGINSIQDIVNKKIALPSKGGGQYLSFERLLKHYQIDIEEIEKIPEKSINLIEELQNGTIDGFFRVRSPVNQFILKIFKTCKVKLLAIDQGAAMKFSYSTLNEVKLPMGSYQGFPPIPTKDLTTVSVERLLLANKHVKASVIEKITTILFEHRRELLQYSPLASFVSQPDFGKGTIIPVHPGAKKYYNRDQPSFIIENADFFTLLLTLIIMFISAIVSLKKKIENHRKNVADNHTLSLISIMEQSQKTSSLRELEEYHIQLSTILRQVVNDLDVDKVTPEGFTFFSFTWNAVSKIIEDKIKYIHRNE